MRYIIFKTYVRWCICDHDIINFFLYMNNFNPRSKFWSYDIALECSTIQTNKYKTYMCIKSYQIIDIQSNQLLNHINKHKRFLNQKYYLPIHSTKNMMDVIIRFVS